MPVPPLPDSNHIETRLLVVAEMLEKAVAEVRRAMDEVRAVTPPEGFRRPNLTEEPR
jgi:hypothetical protein